MLPTEIFRRISVHLPVFTLSVSSILNKIYDESWFRDKLMNEYAYPL